MQVAYCKTNNTNYSIIEFTNLSEPDRSLYRQQLQCKECQQKGYWRKAARDGKPACFGAFHTDYCEYKLASNNSNPKRSPTPRATEEFRSMITNNEYTILDIGGINQKRPGIFTNNKYFAKATPFGSTRRYTKQPSIDRVGRKKLEAIHRMLFGSQLATDSHKFRVPHWEELVAAKDIFIKFTDINDSHLNKWQVFFGHINSADNKFTRLNTYNEDVSIKISDIEQRKLILAYIENKQQLTDAGIVVFGKMTNSKITIWLNKISNLKLFTQLATRILNGSKMINLDENYSNNSSIKKWTNKVIMPETIYIAEDKKNKDRK